MAAVTGSCRWPSGCGPRPSTSCGWRSRPPCWAECRRSWCSSRRRGPAAGGANWPGWKDTTSTCGAARSPSTRRPERCRSPVCLLPAGPLHCCGVVLRGTDRTSRRGRLGGSYRPGTPDAPVAAAGGRPGRVSCWPDPSRARHQVPGEARDSTVAPSCRRALRSTGINVPILSAARTTQRRQRSLVLGSAMRNHDG